MGFANAQRQPTRSIPAINRVPNGTPTCSPSAGPSGGGSRAGKPSGRRRKGDPRQGRRVAPGRCRSLQSEELSRQFGKAVGSSRGQIGVWTGLIIPAPIWREGKDSPSGLRSHGWRSAASALNPPPPSGRWAKHRCRHRAERPKQNPLPKTSDHPPCARLRCANRAYKSEFPARGKRWASLTLSANLPDPSRR